ncbi:uncharacterized protein METZ01_LOCUS212142 [marine metagenome]|jgi:hypothetical protein|uniref:DUF6868 domain-containing protein n=1 Tax=marine metagenome TaxID=408172 RepID=A0A382F8B5_9ZZZZ
MDIATLTEFFKYCTIINVAILLISIITVASDFAYNMHTKLGVWEGSKEAHKQSAYKILGNYKILTIVFNAVPYFALCCCI